MPAALMDPHKPGFPGLKRRPSCITTSSQDRTGIGCDQPGLSSIHKRDQCSSHRSEQHGSDIPSSFDPIKCWLDESTHGDFQFYIDGVTPSVARLLEVLDKSASPLLLLFDTRSLAMDWLKMAYTTSGSDLHEAIHNQPGYYEIKAPSSLNHRYIFEDVPMSLVPIASMAQQYGVSVRGMESIIRIACIIHRTDYWRRGRTLRKLGINQLSVTELTQYVTEEHQDY